MKIGHEEEVMMFPFHKRKVKTISMKPPIFGVCYMKHQLKLKDIPNSQFRYNKIQTKTIALSMKL